MNNAKIQLALSNLFEKQRIVFWYDTRQEFRATLQRWKCMASKRLNWRTTSSA
jgi:hypothetical protein